MMGHLALPMWNESGSANLKVAKEGYGDQTVPFFITPNGGSILGHDYDV